MATLYYRYTGEASWGEDSRHFDTTDAINAAAHHIVDVLANDYAVSMPPSLKALNEEIAEGVEQQHLDNSGEEAAGESLSNNQPAWRPTESQLIEHVDESIIMCLPEIRIER